MAITNTTNFSFRKHDKYDLDWDAALNQNWDDLDDILNLLIKPQLLTVVHETGAGVDGGDLDTTWTQRPITADVNRISGASIALDQITLPAGSYAVRGWALGHNCQTHRALLYDTTGSADLVVGSSAHAASASVQSASYLEGEFTLLTESVLELRHIAGTQKLTDGLGLAANLASLGERFAFVEIRRIAV